MLEGAKFIRARAATIALAGTVVSIGAVAATIALAGTVVSIGAVAATIALAGAVVGIINVFSSLIGGIIWLCIFSILPLFKDCYAFLFLLILFCFAFPSFVFCMPINNGADLGMIEVYRPLIAARFPVESSGTYLFAHFEELGEVIETSSRGQLLGSLDIYELLQQLYPIQLNSLLKSTLIEFGPNAPVILEQYAIISEQLLFKSGQLWIILDEIAQDLSSITGTNITNQSLGESLLALRELYISSEIERYYAARLLQGTQELYSQYDKLFALFFFV